MGGNVLLAADHAVQIGIISGAVAGLLMGLLALAMRQKQSGKASVMTSEDVARAAPARKFAVGREMLKMLRGLGVGLVVLAACAIYEVSRPGTQHTAALIAMLALLGGFAWVIVDAAMLCRRRGIDRCPKCNKPVSYYRKDQGLKLTCKKCGCAWAAGGSPRFPGR